MYRDRDVCVRCHVPHTVPMFICLMHVCLFCRTSLLPFVCLSVGFLLMCSDRPKRYTPYTYMYIHIHAHTHMCVCICVCLCVHTERDVHPIIHLFMCLYMYTYMCIPLDLHIAASSHVLHLVQQ